LNLVRNLKEHLTMRGFVALALAACSSLALAAPFFPGDTPPLFFPVSNTNTGSLDNCPGYTATNVLKTDSSLTADLTLAGSACDLYSSDIKDLKLEVEYQNGEYYQWAESRSCYKHS
jgi:alpha-glucosidase